MIWTTRPMRYRYLAQYARGAILVAFVGLVPGGQSFPECLEASTAQSLVSSESVTSLLIAQTATELVTSANMSELLATQAVTSLVAVQTVEHC